MNHAAGVRAGTQSTFLGHPVGLFVLFFTEMWERFSYYGMRALLMLYMVNYFKWTQEDASQIYKWYTSLVYLTPLLGGFLADRFLGNTWAIIIGATLMAIGHFCMAFEQIEIFYAALIFLIFGNGFFKPNMSTQVGRLYPANDDRRDAAYTIFYMGINLGAFLSPLACGYLGFQKSINIFGYDVPGYHAGFSLAGIGMVAGLLIYLVGLPLVKELPPDHVPPTSPGEEPKPTQKKKNQYVSEAQAEATPSVIPSIAAIAPQLLYVLGALCVVGAIALYLLRNMLPGFLADVAKPDNLVALAVGGGFANFMGGWVVSQLKMAIRDRVLAIFVTALFVIFFWAAFEQAGNAMNIHADKVTNRFVTETAPPPPLFPAVEAAATTKEAESQASPGMLSYLGSTLAGGLNIASGDWWGSLKPFVLVLVVVLLLWLFLRTEVATAPGIVKVSVGGFVVLLGLIGLMFAPTLGALKAAFNPVPTAWFQSINALAIFVMAPLFAWLWIWLPRHGIDLSIPGKVAIGVFLQGMAFALMIWSVSYENVATSASLSRLPERVFTEEGGRVVFTDAPDLNAAADYYDKEHEAARVHGGRLIYDESSNMLKSNGVLSDTDRDRILRATAPVDFMTKVRELAKKTEEAKKNAGEGGFEVSVQLDSVPAGLDMRYAGFDPSKLRFDESTNTLTASTELADKDYKQILVAASDPPLRSALNEIYVESAKFKVGVWWLFWFYILCTLGELCLSPVGLSMVSKLAPARFATMLMGMWLLTSFFGGYLAGFAGENWGRYHPYEYFAAITIILMIASAICFVLVKKMTAMMHGVR